MSTKIPNPGQQLDLITDQVIKNAERSESKLVYATMEIKASVK